MSISVIIPTYNRLALLKETIVSVLKQTILPKEIIIVDNGSTDGTVEYLKQLGNDKIITANCNKRSPGAARNLGFELSTGKYIQYLDSDDLITKNKFETQVGMLNKSSKGMVYCPYVHVSKNENQNIWIQQDVILQFKPIPPRKSLHQYMVKGFFTIIPSFLFDRDFLNDLGPWREDIIAYEDWDYLWRIGNLSQNPPHTNECCYFYRIHGQQTTGTNFNHEQRDIQKIKVFQELYNDYVANDPNLTVFEKSFFRAQIFNSMKQSDLKKVDKDLFKQYSGLGVKLSSQYLRIESKIIRLFTGSNWQFMHGICNSKEQFVDYSNLI